MQAPTPAPWGPRRCIIKCSAKPAMTNPNKDDAIAIILISRTFNAYLSTA